MSTLALWFELDETSAHRFSDAIEALASRFQTPLFVPHITVFGGLSIDRGSAFEFVDGLVGDAHDVAVKFGRFGFDEMWSRSLFVRAFPSESMLEIHDRVATWLGIKGPLYSPYLSLMYGEFDRSQKVAATDELHLHLPESATVCSVSLWHTDPTSVSMWKCLRRVVVPETAESKSAN